MTPTLEQQAEIDTLIEALFTNGFGLQADRLVLTQDGPHRDLGGWSRIAIRDRLLPFVAAIERVAHAEGARQALLAAADALMPDGPGSVSYQDMRQVQEWLRVRAHGEEGSCACSDPVNVRNGLKCALHYVARSEEGRTP